MGQSWGELIANALHMGVGLTPKSHLFIRPPLQSIGLQPSQRPPPFKRSLIGRTENDFLSLQALELRLGVIQFLAQNITRIFTKIGT